MIRLQVWGEHACFTDPLHSPHRTSYPVITPSAASGLARNVYWHPGFEWWPRRVDVLAPIATQSVTCNFVKQYPRPDGGPPYAIVGEKAPSPEGFRKACRTQLTTTYLLDVSYTLHLELVPDGPACDVDKHLGRFCRRAKRDRCHRVPYFGLKSCVATFRLLDRGEPSPKPIDRSQRFRRMFYGWDPVDGTRLSYIPVMRNGSIEIPEVDDVRRAG